jgi:endonuclease YncB( thermonuclease family)
MRKPTEFKNYPTALYRPYFGPYRAVCNHVIDGDTIDCLVDLGLNTYKYVTVRLANVNAPEIFSAKSPAERQLGQLAKAFVHAEVGGKPILIETHKDRQSFGRYVANVWYLKDGRIQNLSSNVEAHLTYGTPTNG